MPPRLSPDMKFMDKSSSRAYPVLFSCISAEIITGYAREELLSMNFWDLVHPDCRELVLKRGGADRELYGMKSPCGEEPTPLVRSFVSSPGRLVHKKTSSRKRDQVYDSPEGESWIH